ncbi:MAG: hypothetical protein LYZ69_08945 [Nitrososphaerales archaeon]|nr:hypothetical protein [Nitrososphaerales archaeon]
MGAQDIQELVFAVDVSSFTKNGFIGTTSFGGKPVEVEFDDGDEGIFLSAEMCEKIGVRKNSKVDVIVEADDRPQVAESVLAGVVKAPRVSNAKVYYEVGRSGGAVVRIRKR